MSFNFNKLRAMVAARVLVGVQLERMREVGEGMVLFEDFEPDPRFTVVLHIIWLPVLPLEGGSTPNGKVAESLADLGIQLRQASTKMGRMHQSLGLKGLFD